MNPIASSNAEYERLHGLMSRTFETGLAGTIAGLLFVGIGGRVVMRISGAINPEQRGAITDSENVVGEVTLEGTLTFVAFEGLLMGFLLGIVWFLVRGWIPGPLPVRTGLAAVLAVLVGGSGIIDSENIDFALLEPAWLHVVMFLALVSLAGGATAALDSLLEDRLPQGETVSAVLGGLAALGLLIGLPLLFAFYFVPGATQIGTPPWPAGLALVAVALATCWGVVSYYRTGADPTLNTERWRQVLGYGGVIAFGALGGVHLAREIAGVL